MTTSNGTPARAALAAVRKLEGALEERNDAHDVAVAGLDAARAEAERLLADARAEGTEAGRRRRAELITTAEADAMVILSSGEAEAAEIRRHQSSEHADLVAEFTAVVLLEQGA
jgi:vacuolar-type H+-ATPase subunit H